MKKLQISSDGFFQLIWSSKLRISIPSIFISCEKLNQFFTPPTMPFWATFVPTPFLRINKPSNTNLLIACLSVLREIFNLSDKSTSLGRNFPFLYSSDSISFRSISSACTCKGLLLAWSNFICAIVLFFCKYNRKKLLKLLLDVKSYLYICTIYAMYEQICNF